MTTTDDVTPDSTDEPDRIGRLFGEVFDLVDETVRDVSDAEVDERLAQLLADVGRIEPGILDRFERRLTGGEQSGGVVDPESRIKDMTTDPNDLVDVNCSLKIAWEQLAAAQMAASAARREAERQAAAAAASQRQAEQITARINAYIDTELDRVDSFLSEARQEATRVVAEAKQQAEDIVSAARAQTLLAEGPSGGAWRFHDRLIHLLVGRVGNGESAWIAEPVTRDEQAEYRFHHQAFRDHLVAQRADASEAPRLRRPAIWKDLAPRDTSTGGDHGLLFTQELLLACERWSTVRRSTLLQLDQAVRAGVTALAPLHSTAGSYRRLVRFKIMQDLWERQSFDIVLDEALRCVAHNTQRSQPHSRWQAEVERTWASINPPLSHLYIVLHTRQVGDDHGRAVEVVQVAHSAETPARAGEQTTIADHWEPLQAEPTSSLAEPSPSCLR